MPFASKAQRAYLFMHHPDVAHEFAEKTSSAQEKRLPEHVKPKRGKRRRKLRRKAGQ